METKQKPVFERERTVDRHSTAWVSQQTQKNSLLKEILHPMLLLMSICGLYNFTNLKTLVHADHPWTIKHALAYMYRTLVFLVVCLLPARLIAAFFTLTKTEDLMLTGAFLLWSGYILIEMLVYLKVSSVRFGQLETMLRFWEEKIVPDFWDIKITCPLRKIRRQSLIVVLLTCIGAVLNTVGIGVMIHLGMGNIFVAPFTESPLTVAFALILTFCLSLVWLTGVTNAIVYSKALYNTLEHYNQYLSDILSTEGSPYPSNFARLRLLHTNICHFITRTDQDFCWHYGFMFAFKIGITLFVLYQILRVEMGTFSLVMFWFWFSLATMIQAISAIFAAYVHEEAHAALDSIYYVNVQDISVERLAQLNLFLSKLTGTQVGFTVCGLLVINKEFILTIAGVFLTYFAILYTL